MSGNDKTRPDKKNRADLTDEVNSPTQADSELSVLGRTVREAVDHVECFPAPANCSSVRFTSHEVNSICPVTNQPDLSSVVIEYTPNELCVESKSLKLFLWSFRDRPIFAEALAVAIATEIASTAKPDTVDVTVTQRPRGGIEIQTRSHINC